MKNIIKVCGDKCNTNFDVIHTRKIIDILTAKYREVKRFDMDLMEIMAGLAFAITGDFDCILSDENTLEDDEKQTEANIDKLYNYLYGGYREEIIPEQN